MTFLFSLTRDHDAHFNVHDIETLLEALMIHDMAELSVMFVKDYPCLVIIKSWDSTLKI